MTTYIAGKEPLIFFLRIRELEIDKNILRLVKRKYQSLSKVTSC